VLRLFRPGAPTHPPRVRAGDLDPRETVLDLAAYVAGFPADEVTPGSRLAEDLGLDSLDRMELVMAVEDALGLEIGDEAAERWETVEDVVRTATGGA
jgi:acyl carrier protein